MREKLAELMPDEDVGATIGIHEDKTVRAKEGGEDGEGEDKDEPLSNAEIGALLHYGTKDDGGHIPPRPFLDVGVEAGTDVYKRTIEREVGKGANMTDVIDKVANKAVASVKKYMRDLRDPPNAESTIKKKKSSNPLIDSGQLRSSITYKVHINGDKE
jgi:phage gpG-like protein